MLEVCMRFPYVVNVRKAFPMDKVLDVIVLGTSRSDDPFDNEFLLPFWKGGDL
jgi:hypothetical protein